MRACAAGRGSRASRHAPPGWLQLPRSFLASWRREVCAWLFSDGGLGIIFFFSPCLSTSGPTQPRGLPRPLALGACGCWLLCPRGGAHERQHQGFSPSAARSKYRGVCDVPTPSRAHVWELSELCLSSPARDCYPLASLICPNLYKCFHKFSGKLRSNLFHPVIPLRSPLRVCFIFFNSHISHYVKQRWRNIFSKSQLPFCLQQQGLNLAAYLIKGRSCTFYSFFFL